MRLAEELATLDFRYQQSRIEALCRELKNPKSRKYGEDYRASIKRKILGSFLMYRQIGEKYSWLESPEASRTIAVCRKIVSTELRSTHNLKTKTA